MYTIITPATGLPVSVEELKGHLGIFHNEKDGVLALYIQSAVDYAERFTGRQLLPAVWEYRVGKYFVDSSVKNVHPMRRLTSYSYPYPYKTHDILIKKAPFVDIVSIKYYNQDNELVTLTTDDYIICTGESTSIIFKNNYLERDLYDRADAMQIRFNCGYASAELVPALIKAAIILIAGKLYENPADTVENLPKASTNLLRQYRV